MQIDIADLRNRINGILSNLEQAKPIVNLPYDGYWDIQGNERYGAAKPSATDIDQGLLSSDWKTIQAVPPGLALLVQLSNLLRVIGDHPIDALK